MVAFVLVVVGLIIFLLGMYEYTLYYLQDNLFNGWEILTDLLIGWGIPLMLAIILLFIIPWYLGLAISFALSGLLLHLRKRSRNM